MLKFQRDALSTPDKAWLLQWVEYKEKMEAMVKKTGTGRFTTEYFVYHPSGSAPAVRLPMMISFHPGGNGHRDILRYVEAADAVRMPLVSCETFQNGKNNKEDAVAEAGYLERFKELLPQIEEGVPHDPNRIFMGGISGGSWRAFHYSAQIPRPWAGIYSNCGWVGDEKYWDLPYPKMRVAFLNGDRDEGRTTNTKDLEIIRKSGSGEGCGQLRNEAAKVVTNGLLAFFAGSRAGGLGLLGNHHEAACVRESAGDGFDWVNLDFPVF